MSLSTLGLRNARRLPMGGARRFLNVHEYVGIEVMNQFGVTTPRCKVADTPDEAAHVFSSFLGGKDAVIKAQVLAGGRGRGTFSNGFEGGVHMCTSADEAKDFASSMLGANLVTKQTGEDGVPCNKVMLAERVYLRREMYLSILMDRGSQGPVVVASPAGGMSIEDVAEETPEKIFKFPIDIRTGLSASTADEIAACLGFAEDTEERVRCKDVVMNIYDMFISTDATLVEINPLAETHDGKVLACDAKLNFDDNAEWRQKEIFLRRDTTQEDPREVEAAKHDLNYIGLDGSIGCMVNGAGLAMATCDILTLKGGSPANFLDVGGGATKEQVKMAFELLNADRKVKAILCNIFGGIMRCDVIASGIIAAAQEIGMKKPIILRLKGTNVDEAKKLIEASGYRMTMCDELEEAAEQAVGIAKIVEDAEKFHVEVSFGGGSKDNLWEL